MKSINDQVLALRNAGGYCLLEEFSLLEFSGPDAARFLQARLSNDVMALEPGQGQMTALLDRKAHVLAYVSLHRLGERYWMLFERYQGGIILSQMEQFHFREDVVFSERSDLSLWTAQGPKVPLLLSKGVAAGSSTTRAELSAVETNFFGEEARVFFRSLTGDPGVVVAYKNQSQQVYLDKLNGAAKALNMVPMSFEARDIARIEAGQPQFAVDFDTNTLLPETGLENTAASYSKGCFQGQEVLARIRTYGAPKRGLVGMQFNTKQDTFSKTERSEGLPITHNDTEIGELKSATYSPTLGCTIGLAYVNREHRVPDQQIQVEIAGSPYTVTVRSLPFYDIEFRRRQAKEKYEAALTEFASGSELAAIDQLRAAIELDPMLADAYESLGVVLSRHDQLDEAINLMKQLEQLDPSSVMAHSNLSVFYMQKGDKEAAEEEKAKAMSIRMEQMAKDFAAKQEEDAERERRKQEAEERMGLFRQVLEIDPDDFLANSGLGGAYVDLEQFETAIPYLEKALAAKQNHTLTYLSLGRAYEKLGKTAEAVETYNRGISVAAQRGEMTPMKEMQMALHKLGAKTGS